MRSPLRDASGICHLSLLLLSFAVGFFFFSRGLLFSCVVFFIDWGVFVLGPSSLPVPLQCPGLVFQCPFQMAVLLQFEHEILV